MKKEDIKRTFKKIPVSHVVLLVVLLALTVVATVFSSYIFGEQSVFNKNVSENATVNALYQKIPALISSIEIIAIAMLIYRVLQLVMRKSFAKSNRAITIVKLVESMLKWLLAIVTILWVLTAWGIDTSTVVASAGILTLIIGFGAQSLVADVVAGMFIVFEEEFQVGDIVIVNGWRGTVDEIGIRTTKIIDWQGNVNIVNNSQITSLVNQTKFDSVAVCYVSVEYGEEVPRVEKVVKDNLERMKKNIPEIIEGPFYNGVSTLGESGVELMLTANCKETDLYKVQRMMNKEIKMIFDENDVTIPFPQIVLNKSKDFDEKK